MRSKVQCAPIALIFAVSSLLLRKRIYSADAWQKMELVVGDVPGDALASSFKEPGRQALGGSKQSRIDPESIMFKNPFSKTLETS